MFRFSIFGSLQLGLPGGPETEYKAQGLFSSRREMNAFLCPLLAHGPTKAESTECRPWRVGGGGGGRGGTACAPSQPAAADPDTLWREAMPRSGGHPPSRARQGWLLARWRTESERASNVWCSTKCQVKVSQLSCFRCSLGGLASRRGTLGIMCGWHPRIGCARWNAKQGAVATVHGPWLPGDCFYGFPLLRLRTPDYDQFNRASEEEEPCCK